ncbi:hypothetical protein J7T55_010253 [Diaporthe amygdali]|uniref:uncharacterized protein n=1 Tax=Phomopsis amygdali TaxID=1214568 RepID=UPI0022FEAD3A|nr:uncharacterized protein J7T55_010253 [Diaporthe amygdali]KAJ0107648.1 hypothetical protein J7T55_010253 [Diaporthe amygdali]
MSVPSSITQFNASCRDYKKYPLNLSYHVSNNGSLVAHRILLKESAPDLFYMKTSLRQLVEDADFSSWLVTPKGDGSTTTNNVRCRFIFLQAESGQAKLDVSLSHAERIFTYFQVMPSYIDFVSAFCKKRQDDEDVSDLRFSSFRETIRLSTTSCGLSLPHLALSGRGFQLNYNLKSVTNKSKEKPSWSAVINKKEKWDWSVRQAVFHHQFDMKQGTSLWIITSARDYLQKRVQKLTGQTEKKPPATGQANGSEDEVELQSRPADRKYTTAEDSFIASLSIHLMLAQYASEDWRGYVRWLEQMLEKKTKTALVDENYDPTTFDLTYVQMLEDKINKAVMTLDANAKVLESLNCFYASLVKNEDFELGTNAACKRATADFTVQLRDFIYDTKMFSDRASTLAKITADRKSLIQQHFQARATDRVEQLTFQQQKEAKIMRVIAVMTLIYLPATFSSTFFSTDVVKYQQDGDGPADYSYTSYSGLALERWFEVTIPLTIITFAVAVGWYYYYEPTRNAAQGWLKGESSVEPKDLEKAL